MNICPGCHGVVGRDCFNPRECEWISRDMEARHHVEQWARPHEHEAHELRQMVDDLAARVAALESKEAS